jgi:hypothetical protein
MGLGPHLEDELTAFHYITVQKSGFVHNVPVHSCRLT